MLGDAFVTIRAETTGFRADAYAQIRKAIAGINPKVPVDLELRDKGKFISAAEKAVRIQANIDNKKAYAQIIELRDRIRTLTEKLVDIPIGVDDKATQAKIESLQLRILALARQLAHLPVGLDTSALIKANAAITALEASTDRLQASSAKAVAAFLAEEEAAARVAEEAAKAAAALTAQEVATDRAATATVKAAGSSTLFAAILGRTAPLVAKSTVNLGALSRVGGFIGAGFAVAGAKVTLFGGLLNGLLPAWATHITVMHIAADALVELIAVWGGAAVAAGAFGVAASDAVQEVARRMQVLHTVADATNQVIPPLTGSLEQLHNAVRPQVYQVFGDALDIAKARTGDFQKIVRTTGPVVDYLAARMTVAISNGKAFDVFTKNASNSLLGLGNSFGNVFGAIGNVLNVVPDYAQKLLSFGVIVTRLAENFTAMIEPVLRWGLAIHGAFIYIGLAVTLGTALYARVLVPMVGALVNAGARAAFFAASLLQVARAEGLASAAGVLLARVTPLGWVALAVAGLTALVLWLRHGSDATREFAQNIVNLATDAPIVHSLTANLQAQAVAAQQLGIAQRELKAAQDALTAAQKQLSQAGYGADRATIKYKDAVTAAQQKVNDLVGAQKALQAQHALEIAHLTPLIKQTGSLSGALGILNAAGITTKQVATDQGQAWAIDNAQIQGTIAGYKAMTGAAGQVNNDMEVLGRTLTDQYTAVQKLNQGWSQFITDVTSTQGSFDTVIQGFEVLASHSGDLKLSLGKLKATFSDTAGAVALQGKLASATAAVTAAQDRLNKLQASGTASSGQLKAAQLRLTAAQDRLTVAQLKLSQAQSGGVAAIDALTPAGIALNQAFTDQIGNIDKLLASWRTAGLANDLFIKGTKDAIAPLVKYAQGSQEATGQLIALAQEAGYTGPNSMKELTKWLGNTKNATSDLKTITDQATVQEALLSTAFQNQGNMIVNQLIGDINQAILAYTGVAQAAKDYGKAIAQSGRESDAAHAARDKLITDLINAGNAANDTKQQIVDMVAKVLGIPPQKAIDILLGMQGQGKITITGTGIATRTLNTTSIKNVGGSVPGGLAAGLYVPHGRGPLIDDYPALLAKGEVVVPTRLVNAGLVDHLRGRIPGFGVTATRPDKRWDAVRYNPYHFASGGLAGAVGGNIDRGIAAMSLSEARGGQAAAVAFAQAAINAVQAAAAAAAAGGGVFLGPGSGSYAADIQTVLRSMGLPLSLTANWLRQIQTESGGNLRAVNLTDSNAAAGHPSVGLLQLIPATFHAYAGPYVNTPPLVNYGGGTVSEDPMAQIYAAIHYAAARYGGAAMAGVIGQGHGYKHGGLIGSTYDKGGILPPWKVGVNTSGKAEMVTPATGAGSLHETNLLLRQLIHEVRQNTRVSGAQGQQFAHGIGVATARGAYRGFYGG